MRKKTRSLAPALAALALAACAFKAQAATNPAYLDLTVTVTGSLSVAIDGLQYSTRTISAAAGAKVVPSSATIVNDVSGFTERWQLSVSTVGSSDNWTVASTTDSAPGLDTYAYQALFISSAAAATCPASGDSEWNQYVSTVTGTAATYTAGRYADGATFAAGGTGLPDGTSGSSNGNMYALDSNSAGSGKRGLCVRLYMPSAVSTRATATIRLTITAVSAG